MSATLPMMQLQVLRATLLVFVAGAFLLPTEPAYALVFYLLPMPLAVLILPATWRRITVDTGIALGGLLIAWSALTLAWGHDDGHRSLRFAAGAAATLLFFGTTLGAWRNAPGSWRHLGTVLIWAGAANAALSVALGPFEPQNGDRLHGWGVTSHPILGASVMAAGYLAALVRVLGESRLRAANAGACAVMALFILLTESRGPLLAASVATLFLCAAGCWRWRALGLLFFAGGAWFLLPRSLRHYQAAVLVARGASHRFEIWHRTLQMVAAHPLLGNGLAANLDLPGMTFPHDLYLSVLFYSGLVGLLLFAGLAGVATMRLWQERRAPGLDWLWVVSLWINTLLSGLTDLGQITKGPGPMWFIVWMPVALILARPARAGESRQEHRDGAEPGRS